MSYQFGISLDIPHVLLRKRFFDLLMIRNSEKSYRISGIILSHSWESIYSFTFRRAVPLFVSSDFTGTA
ncbi:Uncharacterized protein dnm_012770 [Desulfonema magnum]|uniref:Uncharacterized protein n=1 Tax=Desulfonema magnum TaxID=45655 RepID=A0A975GL03_9BACT|nr:Uncharacterized protein dnm_012770 [Desulfonema magnum]